jgi:ribosomal protein S18 acetylase RimI-like enzyme
MVDGRVVAELHWLPGAGEAQIVRLHTHPDHRRQGHATALLDSLTAAANNDCHPLRRLWCVVRQREHVAARAVLTMNGYGHLATIETLYPGDDAGQDGLVYVRTFD